MVKCLHMVVKLDTSVLWKIKQLLLFILRRPPKTPIYQEDELSSFSENDKITEWNKLNSKHSPEGFQFKNTSIVQF